MSLRPQRTRTTPARLTPESTKSKTASRQGKAKLQPVAGAARKRNGAGFVEPEWGVADRKRFVGVNWDVKEGLWKAAIAGQHLGFFDHPAKAGKAYNEAASKAGRDAPKKRAEYISGRRAFNRSLLVPKTEYKHLSRNADGQHWAARVSIEGRYFGRARFPLGEEKKAAQHADAILREFGIEYVNIPEAGEQQAIRGIRQRFPAASSSFVGVSWYSDRSRWRAQIWLNGSRVDLGDFDAEEKAARAYDAAKREQRWRDFECRRPLSLWQYYMNFPVFLNEMHAAGGLCPTWQMLGPEPQAPPQLGLQQLTEMAAALHREGKARGLTCFPLTSLAIRCMCIGPGCVEEIPRLVADVDTSFPRYFVRLDKSGRVIASALHTDDAALLGLRFVDDVRRAAGCGELLLDVAPHEDGVEHCSVPWSQLADEIRRFCELGFNPGYEHGVATLARRISSSCNRCTGCSKCRGHAIAWLWSAELGVRFIDACGATDKVRFDQLMRAAFTLTLSRLAIQERVSDSLEQLMTDDPNFQENVFWAPAVHLPPAGAAAAGAGADAEAAGEGGAEAEAPAPKRRCRGGGGGACAAGRRRS